jgi:hypothetical protein
MKKMYDFGRLHGYWDVKDYAPKPRNETDIHNWGGARLRCLLHAVYTIAFMCLLRFDEALKIQVHDIEFGTDPERPSFRLTLPFRKTDQTGSAFLLLFSPLFVFDLDHFGFIQISHHSCCMHCQKRKHTSVLYVRLATTSWFQASPQAISSVQ